MKDWRRFVKATPTIDWRRFVKATPIIFVSPNGEARVGQMGIQPILSKRLESVIVVDSRGTAVPTTVTRTVRSSVSVPMPF